MAKVVLDANVLIGHLDQHDSLHDRAEELGERIRANGDALQVIDLVLQEAISVLCRRTAQRKQRPPNLPQICRRCGAGLQAIKSHSHRASLSRCFLRCSRLSSKLPGLSITTTPLWLCFNNAATSATLQRSTQTSRATPAFERLSSTCPRATRA